MYSSPIPDFISPLNDEYISIERAAHLIASELEGTDVASALEMFKHAIFSREFDYNTSPIPGIPIHDDRNYPLVAIEAPGAETGVSQEVPVNSRPQKRYGFNAEGIAERLDHQKILPEGIEPLNDFMNRQADDPHAIGAIAKKRWIEASLKNLALISLAAYPAKAQALIRDIYFFKPKLIAWMELKDHRIPNGLEQWRNRYSGDRADEALTSFDQAEAVPSGVSPLPTRDAKSPAQRGAPPKAAWLRAYELGPQLREAHPSLSNKQIAAEIFRRLSLEFDEKDVPSEKTIYRRMKDILLSGA
ncbi:MAG: hypothetical protein WCD42_05525 [Rhizomicrobium sp.]